MNLEHLGRHSIRLKGYDYASAGAYFITVCTYDRQCLFGEIAGGAMYLNETGQAISDEWLRTAAVRRYVTLDEFVLMPNHIHGIMILTEATVVQHHVRKDRKGVGANRRLAPTASTPPSAGSIGAIMSQFKSITTKRINGMLGTTGTSVWQRNYYEHVIRSDIELYEIREYIQNNPTRWDEDSENPIHR